MKTLKDFLENRCWPGYKPKSGKTPYSPGSCVKEEDMEENWSQKYKSSIDCNNPKGFSQKAHCAGKKKNEDVQESAAAAIAAATAIAKKKSGDYDSEGMRKTPYKNPDHPNRKSNAERKAEIKEDLRRWFSKTDPEGGWKRINSKGEAIGPCAREPGEPKPKCMSNEKRAQLSKKERASAVRAKRRSDPNPERKGAPINVSNFGKGKISESMEQLDEKNVPTSPEKWAQAKAQAKAKFDVYPSAYANGWAAKKYKAMGGGWRSESTIVDDAAKYIQEQQLNEVAAWQKKEGKNPEGGLNRKGIASYRAEHPGSHLSMAVTTPPSKLKPGSKAANRRKSFCARMGGMEGPMKKPNGEPTRKALSLRKWNC
jgi:hypothetical protein